MSKYWMLVKREFWESRTSLIKAPLYMSGVLMVLLLMGTVTAQRNIGQLLTKVKAQGDGFEDWDPNLLQGLRSGDLFTAHPDILLHGLAAIYTLFAMALVLVVVAYLVGALYGDRRDQSILFWKSLPIAESQNVVSKLVTPVLAAPAFYWAAALITGLFYLIVFAIYAGIFLDLALPGPMQFVGVYLNTAIGFGLAWLLFSLWLLPLFGWLLVVSAWSRKIPFLVAIGVPLGWTLLEAWTFGSFSLITATKAISTQAVHTFQVVLHHPLQFFPELLEASLSFQFWCGAVICAAFVAISIWLRKNRWEI